MDIANILRDNIDWIKNSRWSGLQSLEEVSIEVEWQLAIGNMYLAIIRVSSSSREETYYLPLGRTSSLPKNLPVDRAIDIGDGYLVEAEFLPEYFAVFEERVFPELIVEHVASVEAKPHRARPLSLQSTNPLVLLEEDGRKFVVKSYRKMSPINLEVRALKKLTERMFPYSPRLYTVLRHERFGVLSVLLEYVQGIEDGGAPFVASLKRFIGGDEGALHEAKKLAEKVGSITAGMHRALCDRSDKFFSPERVSMDDVVKWRRRIMGTVEYSLLHSEEARNNLRMRGIQSISGLLDLYLGKVKMRIHQDYHLGQMVYTGDDFVILDFEGEPNRNPEDRISKEPATRDLACMIRSFDYLCFFALKDHLGEGFDETFRYIAGAVSKARAMLRWEREVIKSFIRSYIVNAGNRAKELTGLGQDELRSRIVPLLLPWVVEKALYELKYEIDYRPDFVPIPVLGLTLISGGRHPIYGVDEEGGEEIRT